MSKPSVTGLPLLPEFQQEMYRRYLPSAYDSSLNVYEQLTQMIEYLHKTSEIVNNVVLQWNIIRDWIISEGVNDAVVQQLDDWLLDGTIDRLINETVFEDINVKINNLYNNKADQSNLDVTNNEVKNLKQEKVDKSYFDQIIKNIGSGSPKGVFDTLDQLKTAYPNGDNNTYVVKDTGKWYYWNGSNWTEGGDYQATLIGEKSITTKEISKQTLQALDIDPTSKVNILNQKNSVVGQIVDNTGAMTALQGHSVTEPIPVEPLSTYVITGSLSSQGGFYNNNKEWQKQIPQAKAISGGGFRIDIPEGIRYIRLNYTNNPEFMIVKGNKYPDRFYRYGERYTIEWLKPNIETIPQRSVSQEQVYQESSLNLFNIEKITNDKFIDNDGIVKDSTILGYSNMIPVIEGNSYTLTKGYSTSGAMYDKQGNYVMPIPHPISTSPNPWTFTVPNGITSIRVNFEKSILAEYMVVAGSSYPPNYVSYGINVDWLFPDMSSIPRNVVTQENFNLGYDINLFDAKTVTPDKIVDNNGKLVDINYFSLSDYIPVGGNQPYTITYGLSSQGGMYDKYKRWIAPLPHPSTTTTSPWLFRVPRNVVYIRLNVDSSKVSNYMMIPSKDYPSTYIPYGITLPWLVAGDTIDGNLKGKTVQFFGDSITEKNFRTKKNYHEYMAEMSGIKTIVNGVSGTGWRTPNGSGSGRPIHERITQVSANADYVCIFAGTNDFGQTGLPFVMGTINDTNPSESFYGAVDYTIKKAIQIKKNTKLFTITPIQRKDGFSPNDKGVTLEQVAEAIKKVSQKYGIPCFDAYYQNNLNVWDAESEKYYFTAEGQPSPDGLHPNDEGHKVLAVKFLEFLKGI